MKKDSYNETTESIVAKIKKNSERFDSHLIVAGERLNWIHEYLKDTKDSESEQLRQIKEVLNKNAIDAYMNVHGYTKEFSLEKGKEQGYLFDLGTT